MLYSDCSCHNLVLDFYLVVFPLEKEETRWLIDIIFGGAYSTTD